MTDKLNRRDFAKTTGAAAAAAAVGFSAQSSPAQAKEKAVGKQKFWAEEIIPGMRKQGEGIKIHVDAEYAPLKAAVTGNAAAAPYIPNPNTWEMKNLFKHGSGILKELTSKYPGKSMKEVRPDLYDTLVDESDQLAQAMRDNGTKVVRFEGDEYPEEILNYNYSWSKQKQYSLQAHGGGDVIGNCLLSVWEVTPNQCAELIVRDAINEIMQNDPNAVWLTMPVMWPTVDRRPVGPFSSGDFFVFEGIVFVGIGVDDPKHIDDISVPRSANDEYTTEIMRRMLKPFGWDVKPMYFNTRYGYHIDVIFKPVERGLMIGPKDGLWHGLPEELKDWEILPVDREEQQKGCCNAIVLDKKKICMVKGCPKIVKKLETRNFDVVEIDYKTNWDMSGSGIHCSVMQLWREFA